MSSLGNLEDIPVADILRVLAAGKKTGLLSVQAEGNSAALRFQRGLLVAAGSARLQGDEAVLDLFGWARGDVSFVPDEAPADPNVTRSLETLIQDGQRVGELLHKFDGVMPSDRTVFQLGAGPADAELRKPVGRQEWQVLRLLDGLRDLREVTAAARVPREDVLAVLADWCVAGFVERVEAEKRLRVRDGGTFAKEAALDSRYADEWRRLLRFEHGVARIEVRTLGGRHATVPVSFKGGLLGQVPLPRPVLIAINARDGDEVSVKPIG